jgi:Mce-associated membrane protein
MGSQDTDEDTAVHVPEVAQEPTADEGIRPVRTSARRRASRPAGPAGDEPDPVTTAVAVARPTERKVKLSKRAAPPPRRRPNLTRVTAIGLAVVAVLAVALAGLVVKFSVDQRRADASEARDQRFVDTANQMIMNMYSWTQNTLDQGVDQFVGNTSGPLRDKFTEGNNTDTLKQILRGTGNSSEAVINASALESIDEVSGNAEVLVAFRVTTSDMKGIVAPTQQQRVRIIVHEDDNGHMTDYDLKWPEGGT